MCQRRAVSSSRAMSALVAHQLEGIVECYEDLLWIRTCDALRHVNGTRVVDE